MTDPFDDLYRAPLGEFTARRRELAAGLRAEGDKEGAKEVAAARKPTVAAWAVNQLREVEPEGLDTLRELHADVTAGGHDLHELLERRRRVVSDLAASVARVLESDGRSPSTFERDVAGTLEAAVVDREALEAVTAGHLTAPLSAPGIEALGITPVTERPASEKDEEAEAREEAERLAAERRAAEERLARADERVAEARKRLADAEKARDAAQAARDDL